jgi:hypothetical protein
MCLKGFYHRTGIEIAQSIVRSGSSQTTGEKYLPEDSIFVRTMNRFQAFFCDRVLRLLDGLFQSRENC